MKTTETVIIILSCLLLISVIGNIWQLKRVHTGTSEPTGGPEVPPAIGGSTEVRYGRNAEYSEGGSINIDARDITGFQATPAIGYQSQHESNGNHNVAFNNQELKCEPVKDIKTEILSHINTLKLNGVNLLYVDEYKKMNLLFSNEVIMAGIDREEFFAKPYPDVKIYRNYTKEYTLRVLKEAIWYIDNQKEVIKSKEANPDIEFIREKFSGQGGSTKIQGRSGEVNVSVAGTTDNGGEKGVNIGHEAGLLNATIAYDLQKNEFGGWSSGPHEGGYKNVAMKTDLTGHKEIVVGRIGYTDEQLNKRDSVVIKQSSKLPGEHNLIIGKGAGKDYTGSYSVIVGGGESNRDMLWLVDWNEPYLCLYPDIKILLMNYERDVILPGLDSKECRIELIESVKQELNKQP